jgi:hypothetical protein
MTDDDGLIQEYSSLQTNYLEPQRQHAVLKLA